MRFSYDNLPLHQSKLNYCEVLTNSRRQEHLHIRPLHMLGLDQNIKIVVKYFLGLTQVFSNYFYVYTLYVSCSIYTLFNCEHIIKIDEGVVVLI